MRQEEPKPDDVTTFKEKLAVLDTLLGEQKFFAGDQVTLADLSLGVVIPAIPKYLESDDYLSDRLKRWIDRAQTACPALKEINEALKDVHHPKK